MGWPWGGGSQDASKGLDNSLREFLKEQTDNQREEERMRREEHQKQIDAAARHAADVAKAAEEAKSKPGPVVPPESQFQDGRYAHLWKTYRSQGDISADSMTAQDHLTAVLANFSDRKAAIGRAAMENCVVEQMEQRECYVSGDWLKTATLCRTETRALNRCYEMQSRFLKALGYLSQPRSEDEEERIQMHADKLYHQMLERERKAQETGSMQHITQTPLIPADEVIKALGEDSEWQKMRAKQAATRSEPLVLSDFTQSQQKEIKKKLETMTEAERAVEMQMLAAERRADQNLVDQLKVFYDQEARERAARKEQGKASISDRLKTVWGWDKDK